MDDLLDEFETLAEMQLSGPDRGHSVQFLGISTEQAFSQIRNDGVGRRPLETFLGETNWKRATTDALIALEADAAQVHAVRLARRAERTRLKAEEEKRKAEEAAEALRFLSK